MAERVTRCNVREHSRFKYLLILDSLPFLVMVCHQGRVVEKDEKMAIHYHLLADMRGNEASKHNLGIHRSKGNANRAMKTRDCSKGWRRRFFGEYARSISSCTRMIFLGFIEMNKRGLYAITSILSAR